MNDSIAAMLGESAPPKKKARTRAKLLLTCLEELNLPTHAALADLLGVSGGTISTWLKANEMPSAIALACETLLRRHGAETSKKDTHLLVSCPAAKVVTLKLFLNEMKVRFIELSMEV